MRKKKEEEPVYGVNCKDFEKMYIGKTKFRMKKRIEQHKKDLDYKRTNSNAIVRYVEEHKHEIEIIQWFWKRRKGCSQGKF